MLIFVNIVVVSEVKSAASRGKKPVTRPASETDLRNARRTRPALVPVSSLETCRKLDSSQNAQIKLTSDPHNSSLDSPQSLSSNKETTSVADLKTGANADEIEAGASSGGVEESNVASDGHMSPCGGHLYECVGSLKLCGEESGADSLGLCEGRSFCRGDNVSGQHESFERCLPTSCLNPAQANVSSALSTEPEADKQR